MTPLINVFVGWHICRISSCLAWGCFSLLIFVCVRVDKKIKNIYIYTYLHVDSFFCSKKSNLVATLKPQTNSLGLQWVTDVSGNLMSVSMSIRRCTLIDYLHQENNLGAILF